MAVRASHECLPRWLGQGEPAVAVIMPNGGRVAIVPFTVLYRVVGLLLNLPPVSFWADFQYNLPSVFIFSDCLTFDDDMGNLMLSLLQLSTYGCYAIL